jgi:hypothetical protein
VKSALLWDSSGETGVRFRIRIQAGSSEQCAGGNVRALALDEKTKAVVRRPIIEALGHDLRLRGRLEAMTNRGVAGPPENTLRGTTQVSWWALDSGPQPASLRPWTKTYRSVVVSACPGFSYWCCLRLFIPVAIIQLNFNELDSIPIGSSLDLIPRMRHPSRFSH